MPRLKNHDSLSGLTSLYPSSHSPPPCLVCPFKPPFPTAHDNLVPVTVAATNTTTANTSTASYPPYIRPLPPLKPPDLPTSRRGHHHRKDFQTMSTPGQTDRSGHGLPYQDAVGCILDPNATPVAVCRAAKIAE